MSEKLGFALVLLVAVASVASLLFMSGTSATGNAVVYPTVRDSCEHIRCLNHAEAYPLLDHKGRVLHGDYGTPVCICPPRLS
jgi:hypothetical protein